MHHRCIVAFDKMEVYLFCEMRVTDVKHTSKRCILCGQPIRHKEKMQVRETRKCEAASESYRQEVKSSGVFTLTSKKAEPKVGHLQMIFRNINLASSLDLPACLLKQATTDCNHTHTPCIKHNAKLSGYKQSNWLQFLTGKHLKIK